LQAFTVKNKFDKHLFSITINRYDKNSRSYLVKSNGLTNYGYDAIF